MKPFRILFRSIKSAFISVSRNFSLSMASILCATITLLIVGVSLIVAANVDNATKKLSDELSIVVYLDKSSTDEDLNFLKEKIENLDDVRKVDSKSKDEWKEEMSTYSASFKNLFSTIDENPLYNSLIVYVHDASKMGDVNNLIKDYDKVDDTNYSENTIRPLLVVFDICKKVTFGLVISMVFVTVFLIGNTIKLTIYSRRDDIEIMRLVGASNIAIKLPFLFEGVIIGFLGSIIPIIVLIYGYLILFEELGGHLYSKLIPLVSGNDLLYFISLVIVVLGVIVGAFGSLLAVRRYLKI